MRAFAEHTLDDAARAAIETHIADCEDCRAWVVAARPISTSERSPSRAAETVRAGARGSTSTVRATLGRYEIRGLLGAGGMGQVHRAYDPALDRQVALKVVADETDTARAALVREARAAARVRHPNVVPVHDVGTADGEVFVAMELVDGETLATWLLGERTWREILDVFLQAGRGLEAAHASGILHRDFKPQNVLVGDDGRTRVTDFGLARMPSDARPLQPTRTSLPSSHTLSGAIVGTPAYMAPEQHMGSTVDARTDQFAYGVALYEALAAVHPFGGKTAHLAGAAGSPGVAAPARRGIPAGLLEIVTRALAVDPAARWSSITELLSALEPFAGRPGDRAPRAYRRWIVGVIAAALVATGVALARSSLSSRATPAVASSDAASEDGPVIAGFAQLTTEPGCDEQPSLSPDGKTVYYQGEVEGDVEIFAIGLDTRHRRRVSHSPGLDASARVSPDGRSLAWVHGTSGDNEIHVLDLGDLTSRPVAIPGTKVRHIDWMSRTTLLAAQADGAIERIEIDGTRSEYARAPGDYQPVAIRQLGSGSLAVTADFEGDTRLFVGGPGSPWREMVGEWGVATGLAVGFEGRLYFVGRVSSDTRAMVSWSPATDRFSLLRLPRPGSGVDVARDGSRLIYSTCRGRSWVARIQPGGESAPLLSSPDWNAAQAVPLDRRRVVAITDREGGTTVQAIDTETGEIRSLSPSAAWQPAVSSDGRRVAFLNHFEDEWGAFVVDVAGGSPRKITDDPTDRRPSFGFDPQAVYVLRNRPGEESQILRVSTIDGATTEVAPRGAVDYTVSSVDESLIYLVETTGGRRAFWQSAGQQARPISQLPVDDYQQPRLSPDAKRLVLVRAKQDLIEVVLDGRTPPRVVWSSPDSTTIAYPAYALDGEGFLLSIYGSDGDLQVVDGVFP